MNIDKVSLAEDLELTLYWFGMDIMYNTSLTAKVALAHRLQQLGYETLVTRRVQNDQ